MVLPKSSTCWQGADAVKPETVRGLKSPGVPVAPHDALTDVLREGARQR